MTNGEPESVIIAHDGDGTLRRAFYNWDIARQWSDVVETDYYLTEVLVVDD